MFESKHATAATRATRKKITKTVFKPLSFQLNMTRFGSKIFLIADNKNKNLKWFEYLIIYIYDLSIEILDEIFIIDFYDQTIPEHPILKGHSNGSNRTVFVVSV